MPETPKGTTGKSTETFAPQGAGMIIPFESISDPGTYICNWSGHLLRIPEDAVAPGRSPTINMVGNGPLYVTKLSQDPFIPRTKAKILASNYDLQVDF